MKRIKWSKYLAFALVISLIVTACSSDDGTDQPTNQNTQSQDGGGNGGDGGTDETAATGDDDGEVTFGGGELPDDMPVPVPDGGAVQMVSTSADGNLVSLSYPGSDYDSIVEHFQGVYDDLAGENASVTNIEEPPAKAWTWNTSSGGFVSISATMADDATLVQIIYGDS